MFNNYPYIQPQQMVYPSTVQRLEPIVKCWFVRDKAELDNIRPEWNTIYIGINKNTKEIYTKQMRNDGLTDFFVYNQSETLTEKSDMKTIIEKLKEIELKLGGSHESTDVNSTINAGSTQKQSNDEHV